MHNLKHIPPLRLLFALVLLVMLGVGLVGLRSALTVPPPVAPASADPDVPGHDPYLVTRGENPADESADLNRIEAVWDSRITYPTGRFEGAWLQQAAAEDRLMPQGRPAGQTTYNRAASQSPLTLDPNQFTALGPAPLQSNGCQGCYSYGHVSGRVNAVVIDPVTPNVAYLASVGGGVWKTTNCCTTATTWAPVTDDPLLATISVDALAIDPTNHNIVYAGTGDLNFGSFAMGSTGIYKSTDQGATWAIMGANVFSANYPEPGGQFPQYQAVGKVAVDPRNSNNLIAGTKTGVFFSYDAGANWSGPCLPDVFTTQRQDITGLLVHDNGALTDLYVAVGTRGFSTTVQYDLAENGANGIYRSTVPVSGCPATWILSSTPANGWPAGTGTGTPYHLGGDPLGRIDIAMAPSNPNYIYAQVQSIQSGGGYQTGGQLGLWRTTDGGATWTQQSTPAALTACGMDYNQNWYDQGIAVDPNNPDTFLMDTFDIWRSTNGGTSFTDTTCGYAGGNTEHVDQHALYFVPGSSTTLLAGSDGGIYVSSNGGTSFTQLNDTMNTIEFYSGDITGNFANSANPGANGGAQDNGSSVYQWSGTPGPALWQLRVGGDGFYARIEPVLNQRWYQENNNGSLYRSTTGPYGSFSSITGGWTGDTRSFTTPYEIYKYDCPPTGCTHLIVGSNRVWETTSGGTPWVAVSTNLTKQTLADRSFINQLSYAVSMSTTAIVGTNDGNVQYGFGLGAGVLATWVNVTGSNAVLPNRPILDVATDPVNPLIGYAAVGGFDQNTPSTPGHVYQVTCSAACATFTWANKSGNLPNIPVDSIIANPNYPQQVFAGSDWGLYFTNDITAASPTWQKFTAGLPNVMIWDMQIDRGFTTLSLWTRSRGAYVWPLPAGPVGGTPTPVTPSPTSPPATLTPTAPPATATNPPATATNPPATNTPGASPTTAPPSATAGPPTNTPPPAATNTPGPSPTPCSISFSDVHPTDYFYQPVLYLACHGVVSGYADGTFRPFNNTTRAQMVKIVVLGFGLPITTPAAGNYTFTDVPPTFPFFGVIETAAAANIVSGYNCGGPGEPCDSQNRKYFRPYAFVTRGQLSKIDVVAAGWTLVNPPTGSFEDVAPGTAFYQFVETAYCHNIISGYSCGGAGEPCDPNNRPYFRQGADAIRGQIAKIVYLSITGGATCAPGAPVK